jgi:hypothetical protein
MSNSKSIAKKEVKKPPKKYREGLVTYYQRGNILVTLITPKQRT